MSTKSPDRNDDVDIETYQLGGELRDAIQVPVSKSTLDDDVSTLDVAQFGRSASNTGPGASFKIMPMRGCCFIYSTCGSNLAAAARIYTMERAPPLPIVAAPARVDRSRSLPFLANLPCLSWLKTGRSWRFTRCPLFPQERRSVERVEVTAKGQKLTFRSLQSKAHLAVAPRLGVEE
jgi:hypothetical protein